jgi:chromosome segregation ATPase
MAGRTKLEVWNARTSCSHTKNEEDEGETGVEILKTKEIPDGAPPPFQNELHELREYPKDTSGTATVKGRLLTKLMSHWLNIHSLKKETPLHREIESMKGDTRILAAYMQITEDRDALTLKNQILGEQCKDTAELEEQGNLIVVEQDKLRKDGRALMYEVLCISEEKRTRTKDIDSLNLEVEKLRGQCKKTASLEEQLNQIKVECNELRKDREALIYEATRISEEKEAMTKDRDALNLEVEKLREQCKEVAALKEQLKQMTVEGNELRKDREALIYEAISISEAKEDIKLDRDVLKLEIENVRIKFGRKF